MKLKDVLDAILQEIFEKRKKRRAEASGEFLRVRSMNGWLQSHFGRSIQPVRLRSQEKPIAAEKQSTAEIMGNFSEQIEAGKEKKKKMPLKETLEATSGLIDKIIEAEKNVVVRKTLRDTLKVSTFYNEF